MLYDPPSADGRAPAAPRVIAECYVRMVFLKGMTLTKPPDRILEAIEARRHSEVLGHLGLHARPTPWLDAELWERKAHESKRLVSPVLTASSLSDETSSYDVSDHASVGSAGEAHEQQPPEPKLEA